MRPLDLQTFVAGMHDGSLYFFTHCDGKKVMEELSVVEAHGTRVFCMAAHSRSVVTGSWEGALKVWNADSGQETATVLGTPYDISCVFISAAFIAAGTVEGDFFVWDAQTFDFLCANDASRPRTA